MPLVVLENICWAFNSYEGTFQLQTVYLENTPFVAPFRMDCVGAIDTIPITAFSQIKNEVVARLYSPSAAAAGASAAAIATCSAAAASAASGSAATSGPTAASAIAGEGAKRRRIVMEGAGFAEPPRSAASPRKSGSKGKGNRKEPATQRYEDYGSDVDEADIYDSAGTSSSSSQGGAGSSSCDGEEED